jgi:K+-transporting ATPase KdpF subunit
MSAFDWAAGVLALALAVYLFVVLLLPEKFS